MVERVHFRCGMLFCGQTDEVLSQHTVVAEDGVITAVVPNAALPNREGVTEVDYTRQFVIPGMIDVHTHLAYGNAKTEEDIDIYAPMEFRTLRGMYFAHHVLAAGVTSIVVPGGSGLLASSVRDAVDAGLFEGPRTTAAGPYITSRQGLTDWYPTWIGVPTTSIGRLVKSRDEAIEEVRRQVKDGVDAVKIALDGVLRRPDGEYVAAFNLEETCAMVDEIHRLGKIAVAHCRGREATLYAGKAGIDLIFHASYIDDEALDAVVKNDCAISPSLTLLRNTIDFVTTEAETQPDSRRIRYLTEFEAAIENLKRVKAAGVPMPTGTDTGFAVTPFGEWHARELEIYVNYLGFSPKEALRAATSVSAKVVRPKDKVGTIAPGFHADLIALNGDPTNDVSILLDHEKFEAVIKGGTKVTPPRRNYDARRVSDFAMNMFNDHYTRARVAELGLKVTP